MKVKKLFESVAFGKIITGKINNFFSFQEILINFTQGFILFLSTYIITLVFMAYFNVRIWIHLPK